MVALVSEHGYEAVTIRSISRLARVSTRAFYVHFRDKEHCFVDTYEGLVDALMRRIAEGQRDIRRWDERLRLMFDITAREVAANQAQAHLILVDSQELGLAIVASRRRMIQAFEDQLSTAFENGPGHVKSPNPILAAVVEGASAILAQRVGGACGGEMAHLGDALYRWALSYRARESADIARMHPRRSPHRRSRKVTAISRQLDPYSRERLTAAGVPQVIGTYRTVTELCREIARDRQVVSSGMGGRFHSARQTTVLTTTVATRIRTSAVPEGDIESDPALEAAALAAAGMLIKEFERGRTTSASSLVPLVTFVASVPGVSPSVALHTATAMAT